MSRFQRSDASIGTDRYHVETLGLFVFNAKAANGVLRNGILAMYMGSGDLYSAAKSLLTRIDSFAVKIWRVKTGKRNMFERLDDIGEWNTLLAEWWQDVLTPAYVLYRHVEVVNGPNLDLHAIYDVYTRFKVLWKWMRSAITWLFPHEHPMRFFPYEAPESHYIHDLPNPYR